MESNLSLMTIPDSAEMFARFSSEAWALAILILAMVLSLFTVCLYFEVIVFLHRHFELGPRRGCVIFLSGLYSVYSATSLLGVCIPTASFVCSFVADLYLAVTLYVMLLLITDLFGGVDSMLRALSKEKVSLRQPPCCCCLVCLTSVVINKKSFSRIRLGVAQFMFVAPATGLFPASLWVDKLVKPNQTSSIYDSISIPVMVINLLSTIMAIYSLLVLFKAVRAPLSTFYIRSQFVSMQLVLVVVKSHRAVISILVRAGAFACLWPLTCVPELNLSTLLNLLILFEMPLLAVMHRAVIGRWIRSGTHTKHFEGNVHQANVESSRQCELGASADRSDGAVENKAFPDIAPDVV